MDVVENDFGVETLRVFGNRSISSGPCTPIASAGQLSTSVVVMSCPPWAMPVMIDRVEVGAGGIHRRGISGRAGTENDKAGMFACHSDRDY